MTHAAIAIALSLAIVAGSVEDKVSDGQWFHSALMTSEAHAISKGEGTRIALIDSGVDAAHPDLAGSILSGVDLTANGDGWIDTDGHGTAMAGLLVGHGKVNGLAPKAAVLPVRVMNTGDDGAVDLMATGIRWAVSNGARVISISQGTASRDLLLEQEVRAAIAADVVVVAAAGNRPKYSAVAYPAAFPGVLAVSATGKNGSPSSNTISGAAVVIAAPGEAISSTGLHGGYREGTGTSDAAAIVAGAVALVRSKFPKLKGPEVVRRLTATAIDKGPPGRDSQYGYGVLNIVGALTADLPQGTSTPTATLTSRPADPPGGGGSGFPWWLIAVPVVIVGGAAAFFIMRRKTREE